MANVRRIPHKVFLLIIFITAQNLFAQDLVITGKETGFDFRYEYNRSMVYSLDFAASGALELNGLYTIGGGFSLGDLGGIYDIKTYIGGKAGPLFGNLVSFSLSYIYNGLPAYGFHSHSLLPVVYLDSRWAGIAVGTSLRFTRFFGESPLFEHILSFCGYVNFINNDRLVLGISVANFGDFYAGNMGSYSIRINSLITIDDQWSVTGVIELLQSGGTGLTTSFYGIAFKGGFRYSW